MNLGSPSSPRARLGFKSWGGSNTELSHQIVVMVVPRGVVSHTSCPDAHVGRYVGTLKLSHITLDCFRAVSKDCLPLRVSF